MTVGEHAFQECGSLADITAGPKIERIGANAFKDTLKWTLSGKLVRVGDWIVGCKQTDLASAEIEEGVRGIADYAFANQKSLYSVTLPSTLEIIGEGAFAECVKLKNIEVPDGVKEISDYAFYDCRSLDEVILPEGLTSVGRSAFYKTASLKNIDFPDSLTYIGDYAFYQSSLLSLNLGGSVKEIGGSAFYNNEKLELIQFSEGLEKIGDYAFAKSIVLGGVSLPDSLQSLGAYAFTVRQT